MNAITSRSKLVAVAPKAARPPKAKTLIYGKPAVGKSWAALDFPSVYYIDTEGGASLSHYTDKLDAGGGVYLGPDQGATDFAAIIGQVKALATERHGFRTLVIDSISKVYAMAISCEAERLGAANAFGADKKPAVAHMRSLVAALMRLDMNVLLIAHEKDVWEKNSKGVQEVVGATFDCWEKLEYELDLVLRITKQGNGRYATVHKSRLLGFPDNDRLRWSYDDFAERYGRDVIEAAAAPIVLATAEQVAEAKRLLDVVKMPDGWLEKGLSSAGVDTIEELDTDRIAKLISAVKERTI